MTTQIFLIAPPDTDAPTCLRRFDEAIAAAPVAALLLPRGVRGEGSYKSFVKAIAPRAQAAGVAVLIEGDPGLVRMLGADGLHVQGSITELKAATQALKPDYIVGAGQIASRHDAMSKGELGPDYVFFGPLSGPRDPEQREMARWWAQIMEVPSVLSDPAATADTATSEGSEFIGLGDSLWSAPEGVTARLEAIAKALEAAP
ncbi:MAG TPA: thiamine phosphate synthase [Devosia sp.]|jgi:thiamine-phosphate pyrophosphorylase|nr:thiamine phosphate synthase [Devosia sp.]